MLPFLNAPFEKALSPDDRMSRCLEMIIKKRWKDIGEIDERIWSIIAPLRAVHEKNIYLASATLMDERTYPCVVFVEKSTHEQWQLFPRYGFIRTHYKFDNEKMIDASSIKSVAPSPFAVENLDLVEKLNLHGHYDDFNYQVKLKLRDGREYWIKKSHDFMKFIPIPDGYTEKDIVDAEWPEGGDDDKATDRIYLKNAPKSMLCIFQRPKKIE